MSVSVHRSRRDLLRAPLLIGAAGASAAAVVHLRDPHDAGSYGYCPFLALTGRPCPGCGGLRAVNDLTHGDVLGAMSSNVLAVALVVALGLAWLVWTTRRWQGDGRPMIRITERTGLVVVALFVVFGVVRNLSWGSWLAP